MMESGIGDSGIGDTTDDVIDYGIGGRKDNVVSGGGDDGGSLGFPLALQFLIDYTKCCFEKSI